MIRLGLSHIKIYHLFTTAYLDISCLDVVVNIVGTKQRIKLVKVARRLVGISEQLDHLQLA